MAALTYPINLPGPEVAKHQPRQRVAGSDFGGGRPNYRARERDYSGTFTAEFFFTREQAEIFYAWWRDDLAYGGRAFNALWPSLLPTLFVYHFLGTPTFNHVADGAYRVSITTELRGSYVPVMGVLGDPLFLSVALLLHFDGAEGSTDIIDSSSHADHRTAGTGISVRTAHSKFGGSSLRVDQTNPAGLVYTGSRFARAVGQPLCAEFWVKNVAQTNFTSAPLILRLNDAFGTRVFQISRYGNTGHISLTVGVGSQNIYAGDYDTDGFCHVALDVGSDDAYRFYIGGALVESGPSIPVSTGSPNFFVAGIGSVTPNPLEVYVDEVRLTMGASRYPAPFTPPTEAFAASL